MTNYHLVVAPAAQHDLANISQYSAVNWGNNKAQAYIEKLKAKLWGLIEQPFIGVLRDDLLANMRSAVVEQHIIYYRIHAKAIEIIRVLHVRQDPLRHFKKYTQGT